MATNVTIIGVGLIGGSLGMALRRARSSGKRCYWVRGWGRHPARLKTARRLGAVDSFSRDLKSAVSTADIVVLCVPVQTTVGLAKRILPLMRRGAVLTDAGSVKGFIVQAIQDLQPQRKGVFFVGGHPMAGSEKTGLQQARPELYKGSRCVLTTGEAPLSARRKVQALWRAVGARCLTMTADRHDHLVGITSHLPHLVSFALFSLIEHSRLRDPLVRTIAAGSFRDMTRVAGADASLWAGIMAMNKVQLRTIARQFQKEFNQLQSMKDPSFAKALRRLSGAKKRWHA